MEHWCPTEHWCSLEHGSCHHHRPPFLQLGRQSEGKRSDLERWAAAQGRLCPGCCGVKPPSASKGQGIEDQTLPALPAGAMTWELGPGAPNQLSLVRDRAHWCRWQQRRRLPGSVGAAHPVAPAQGLQGMWREESPAWPWEAWACRRAQGEPTSPCHGWLVPHHFL